MNIREMAEKCEAKLYAFRKSRDGMICSFVLHPSDVPQGLQLAPIGQRYVLAFVAIGDDEQPTGKDGNNQQPAPASPPGRAKKSWDQISPAEQAGIVCSDPSFHRF